LIPIACWRGALYFKWRVERRFDGAGVVGWRGWFGFDFLEVVGLTSSSSSESRLTVEFDGPGLGLEYWRVEDGVALELWACWLAVEVAAER